MAISRKLAENKHIVKIKLNINTAKLNGNKLQAVQGLM